MYFQQVPVLINHDWLRTKSIAQRLVQLKEQGSVLDFGNSVHYDLGPIGSISDHKLSARWFRVAGPNVRNTMPWLITMIEMMKDLQPDDGVISYLEGDGGLHTDNPEYPSAFNYIFDNEDQSAYTWVEADNQTFNYKSQVDTAWILNTQMPHGIKNNGKRWALSIHFKADYDTLKKWFDVQGKLIFGNKE